MFSRLPYSARRIECRINRDDTAAVVASALQFHGAGADNGCKMERSAGSALKAKNALCAPLLSLATILFVPVMSSAEPVPLANSLAVP